jgi:hypothetical protein
MGTAKMGAKRWRPPKRFGSRKHKQRKSAHRRKQSIEQRIKKLRKSMRLLTKQGRLEALRTIRLLKSEKQRRLKAKKRR